MEPTLRCIVKRFPHPRMPEGMEVLVMDDGYTSVVPLGQVPPSADGMVVRVSGADVDIGGIHSYGAEVRPVHHDGMVGPQRQCEKLTLSDCFRGTHLGLFLWGELGPVPAYGDHDFDMTYIELKDGDRAACVTADRAGMTHVFLDDGTEVTEYTCVGRTQLHSLRDYYAFCGVLSADGAEFTTHMVWSIRQMMPVGPPFDRRMADYARIQFAPTSSYITGAPGYMMVRHQSDTPMLVKC